MIKKILMFFISLLMFLMFTGAARAQGQTSSPYSVQGWDSPVDSTTYFHLYIFGLLTNPGGWRNYQTDRIDSVLNALIVYTDTKQLVVRNDTLITSDTASGIGTFTSTNDSSHVAVIGMLPTDIVVGTARSATYNVNDIISIVPATGYFTAWRNSTGGTSGLTYSWIWIRKYQ